jgi:peptide deformylase
MAVRELLLYPDPRLKQVCAPVTAFDDDLRALVQDLRDTLAASPGVGIAAPQIGVLSRVLFINVSAKFPDRKPVVLINPEILELDEFKIIREGCLSIPEFTANVRRGEKSRVRAFDEWGQPFELSSSGLEAIAVQHENDHLDGILFLDRVASLKTDVFRRKGFKKPAESPEAAGTPKS